MEWNLTLKRIYKGPEYTIGHLYVNGEYFCDTLEDTDRGLDSKMGADDIYKKKIYSKTAIPIGTYRLILNQISPKFMGRSWAKIYNGVVPRLYNVPGFSGILIHPGNTAADTDGCILVGENKVKGKVINSQSVWKRLMSEKLMPFKAHNWTITIK